MRTAQCTCWGGLLSFAMWSLTVCEARSAVPGNYPARMIRLVVPSSPGGGSDLYGRILAKTVGEALGQQIVVDNRAGAGGVIGVDIVAKSTPDGYTLLITPASLAINPSIYKKLPYNALRDLAPISQVSSVPNILVLHPAVPAKSLPELVALAKAKPGGLTIACGGIGTSPHLAAELLRMMAAIDLVLVPYKGSGQAVVSVLSGEVAMMFGGASIMGHIRAGRLRALAVTTTTRNQALPEIPTVAEAGVPGYEATQWHGVLTRAGTPRGIIDRIYREIARVMDDPDVRERIAAEGATVVGSAPDEFAAYIKSETEKWARVIKAAGIKPE